MNYSTVVSRVPIFRGHSRYDGHPSDESPRVAVTTGGTSNERQNVAMSKRSKLEAYLSKTCPTVAIPIALIAAAENESPATRSMLLEAARRLIVEEQRIANRCWGGDES